MTDLNKWIGIGRLTKDVGSDPQGRDFGYLQNGSCKAVVSIAVNFSKKDQNGQWTNDVNYFDITIFGKTAENLKPYLLKGTQIAVEAHLKQDRWTDAQGANHSRVSIVADSVELLGGKKEGGQQYGQATNQQSSYAQQYAQQNQPPVQQAQPQFQQQTFNGQPFDEDIPF